MLAFMLVLITGTSYFLISKFNANVIRAGGEERTRLALNQARQALIGYAVTFPEIDAKSGTDTIDGPGYLPCADINNNGSAGSSCSLSGGTSIGRFPYKTLEAEDIKDSYGERLWYVVADNFRNNPKTLARLNSETVSNSSGNLEVNGQADIAAIIFAPGAPQNDQNRDVDPNDYTNYIEAVFTSNNRMVQTAGTDNYIILTKDELMQAVEKRVIGQVKMMLTEYNNNYGAYPWLAPFADPKAEFKNLRSTHNGNNNSSSLTDSTVNFVDWDIQNGDIVINITDGSMGLVTAASSTTLTLGAGLLFGVENDFDKDDEYVVYKKSWNTNLLSGTATSGSSNLILNDSTKDFIETGVIGGSVIDNLTDGSSGVVEEVISATRLNVKALNGGTANVFTSGDIYQIRSNVGRATGGSSATLVDTAKDFIKMGVIAGDLLMNLSDNSIGTVSSVSTDTLTFNSLSHGSENDFDINDYYYIPRFNTDNNTREGLLAFHEEGKIFPTAFDIDFNITADSGDITFDSTNYPGAQADYMTAVQTYITSYVNSSSVSFDYSDGVCTWITGQIADCQGKFDDYVNISGRDTASVNSQTQIVDSTADFVTDGVKRGDLAHNFDDESFVVSGTADSGSNGTKLVDASANFSVYEPYNYVIQNDTLEAELGQTKIQGIISEIVDANTLVATSYVGEGSTPIEFRPGDTYRIYEPRKDMVVTGVTNSTTLAISKLSSSNPDFDAGEYYRIIPAAKASSGTVDSTSPLICTASQICTLTDLDGDFVNKGIAVGDTIENTSDTPSQSFGEITAVTDTTITTRLYGGTFNIFTAANNYTIYHDYVHLREHEIHTRFSGNFATTSSSGKRMRDVCMGYTADCSTMDTPVAFPDSTGVSLITIHDYESDGTTKVGKSTFTPSSSSTGSLRVSNIDFYLAESADDIPGWFFKNNWHQFIYIAYSVGNVPGATANCIAGTNCLTLVGAGPPDNDKQAIVIIAGDELDTQDRSTATLDSYLELENAVQGDDQFRRAPVSSSYNDQVRIIE